MGPLTEWSEMVTLSRWKPASRHHSPSSSACQISALILPLTLDALTGPVTPLIERPPLITGCSQVRALGTMMWYSTLAGCSASAPVYWVWIETGRSMNHYGCAR
jgi:hypothetical protein